VTETVAILGAGKLGLVLARLAVAAGYEVRIAGSGDPKYIDLNVDLFAKGAGAMTAGEAISGADLVVLAIPLHRLDEVPASDLAGHIVIDAMNHWLAVDGPLPAFTGEPRGTSGAVAAALPGARVVKALGHVSYQDLDAHARDERRIALGVASDDAEAAQIVARFIDRLGFEPVVLRDLAAGVALEPGSLSFGAALLPQALNRNVSAHTGVDQS